MGARERFTETKRSQLVQMVTNVLTCLSRFRLWRRYPK